MAKKRARGRYWVAFWLAFFLVVAAAVVRRQKAALDTAARLRTLRESRGVLEATQAELERRIRVASTAEALLQKVARSGLSLPADTATTILVVGRDRASR
jgi:cell division protein FtsB